MVTERKSARSFKPDRCREIRLFVLSRRRGGCPSSAGILRRDPGGTRTRDGVAIFFSRDYFYLADGFVSLRHSNASRRRLSREQVQILKSHVKSLY